ncbi:hypothetical protein ACFVSS_04530 [Peribacillus butanolivorans]|uniref:hypothetical protein n=1 Tax=Peribacillus butanolivorans TaxID=421767 RepID=UPI0036DA5736
MLTKGVRVRIPSEAFTSYCTVALFPSVVRFFNEVTATVTGAGNLTIAVEDFWTDTGADATTLPALATDNSYFNGYVIVYGRWMIY